MITYATTYTTVTHESAEYGDFADSGFISEQSQDDFRDMVDRLQGTEPNCSDIDSATWFSTYPEIDDYSTCEEITYSYHPATARDLRYMVKAWKMGNGA